MLTFALTSPLVFGVAVLAVDAGINYVDRRALQSAADVGALAGTPVISKGTSQALIVAEQYAWQDLRQPVPAAVSMCSGTTCTVTDGTYPNPGGYQITATTPYMPRDPAYAGSASETMAVDIVHNNPRSGFEGIFGFSGVTITAHAAAMSTSSITTFPFALGTRYLEMEGNTAIATYGAALVTQCNDNGKGDFVDNGYNGGIRFNGNSELDVGQVHVSTTDSHNTSAQAVLLQRPSTGNCSPGVASQNASAGWNTFLSKVNFNSGDPYYNYFFGYNSGPGPYMCNTGDPATFDTCTTSPIGTGSNWEDGCWQQSSGTNPPHIYLNSGIYVAGLPFPGLGGTSSTNPCSISDSHEGSFADWHGFPNYSSPSDILDEADNPPRLVPPSSGGVVLTLNSSSTTINPNQYFGSVNVSGKPQVVFQPGWYVFDGPGASVTLSDTTDLWACAHPSNASLTPTNVPGCVFIFENGASFTLNGGTMNCVDDGLTYGNCAFQFSSLSGSPSQAPTAGLMSLGNHPTVSLHPIQYTDLHGNNVHFPLIHSRAVIFGTNANNCPGNTQCAITMVGSARFDVTGTIYTPLGVANFSANASPVSGQLIADTLWLQSGAAAGTGGVGFNGTSVAPVASPPRLIE